MNNYLQMTQKELDINTVMDLLIKKQMGIKEASKRINKCIKQTRRILNKYRKEGSKGLIHKARGKPSNNKGDTCKYNNALEIIKENYYDYGPTLSAEKLLEKHNLIIPVSTLRLQMIKAGIWKGKIRKKQPKQFTARPRKNSYGEMVQYDGSYHLWFEGRNGTQYQCLLVAIDDATGEVTAKFALNEGLIETMRFWKEYILEKGKPKSIYLDKFATYKVNYPNATDDKELPTQFNRSCNQLGTKLIFANTPQAKGRVERMNKTLQDRLVKALREENISNIDEANIYLKEVFIPDFNKKFMVEAKSDSNLHLHLRKDEIEKLDHIFSKHIPRKIANDFTIKIDNKFYQLFRKEDGGYTIKPKETITVEKHLNGDIKISKNGIYIVHKISHDRPERQYKLLTAPVSESGLYLMKKNIVKKENEIKILKEENKQNIKTDTYYEKHGKCSPFIANCFN